jgi:hypothetical protein
MKVRSSMIILFFSILIIFTACNTNEEVHANERTTENNGKKLSDEAWLNLFMMHGEAYKNMLEQNMEGADGYWTLHNNYTRFLDNFMIKNYLNKEYKNSNGNIVPMEEKKQDMINWIKGDAGKLLGSSKTIDGTLRENDPKSVASYEIYKYLDEIFLPAIEESK